MVVAAGGEIGDTPGSVIVATSKGYVRFFSASGIQRYLWRVEEVVSMVAGKEGVMIVHREGGTSLDGMSFFTFFSTDRGRNLRRG
jgi:chromosome transmission fidelity protein 4